jgi:hypothetical protein
MKSNKTERLNMKVQKSDKNALRQMSETEGEPMSVLVRRILKEELKRRGYLPLPKPFQPKERDDDINSIDPIIKM